jgi:hypothetical protein
VLVGFPTHHSFRGAGKARPLGNNSEGAETLKLYYVGGIISLAVLPFLLLVCTSEIGRGSSVYTSIEIIAKTGHLKVYVPPPPECVLQLAGSTEIERLQLFDAFCVSKQSRSDTIYRVDLPRECNYNLFVSILDILRERRFKSGVTKRTIRFAFSPDVEYRQTYEASTWAEEFQYIRSEIGQVIDSTVASLGGHPKPDVRIMVYSDMAPTLTPYGDMYVTPVASAVKAAPKSAAILQVPILWLLSLAAMWLVLLILSLRRIELLPNQRLHLTPRRGHRGIDLSHL